MKKIFILFLFISLNIFSAESIKNYHIDVNVNKNGSVSVIEKITYLTDEIDKRGIYRIIPFKYSNASYFKMEDRIKIENFSVKYSNGEKVEVLDEINDNVIEYRLGSEDIFLKADVEYTYEISYDIYNILRKENNVTQLYFNVLGNYWEIPIEKFSFSLTGIEGELEVYTGKLGEKNLDYNLKFENGKYEISSSKSFGIGEGMSFLINSTSFNYNNLDLMYNRYVSYKLLFILPLIILILLILNTTIFINKIKNRIKKSIVVEFLPPSVSPLLARRINSEIHKYANLTIVIFQLIKKDIIKFREKNEKHNHEEYVRKVGEKYIKKIKKYNDYVEREYYIDVDIIDKIELTKEEDIVLNGLILVKNDIYKNPKILASLESELSMYVEKEYANKFASLKSIYLKIILMIIFSTIAYMFFFSAFEFISILIFIILFLLSFVNSITIYDYTDLYKETYVKIQGFKKFLISVEKNKFKYFNNIEEIVKYFKEILPYALALGLENSYLNLLDSFINIYQLDREEIYDLIYYYHFINAYKYNKIIHSNINKVNSSNSYGGKSNYSGGFSSGGFSGGGFAGGGGRSW